MKLTPEKNGTPLTVRLSGEPNTLTAPELSALQSRELGGVKALTLDFKECDYGLLRRPARAAGPPSST